MDDRPTANDPRPLTAGGWLRQNATSLVIVGAVIALVLRYLDPVSALTGALGLSFIIFIHELGHFLAAKWCDVHVKTFSIGFGPAIPGCQFKYGETTYKLAMIPLGGFVGMVGEGDQSGDVVDAEEDPQKAKAEAKADPRSFAKKSVPQRMLVISAGVIMNLILGAALFAYVYTRGIDEVPAVVSAVEPGSAAWRNGIRPGSEITKLNGRRQPFYDDLAAAVTSTAPGEAVDLDITYRGQTVTQSIEPVRMDGAMFPTLGVISLSRLTVVPPIRTGDRVPAVPGSPADKAGFRLGDKLLAMSDPADPAKLTPFTAGDTPGEFFDYHARLQKLAGQPVQVRVRRGDAEETLTVPPAFRKSLGLRMRPGAVTAVRVGSPAEKAGVRPRVSDAEPGDEIVAVEVPTAAGPVRYTADATEVMAGAKPLDPVRLPWQLFEWSATRPAGSQVKVTVLRGAADAHTRQRAELSLDWDDTFRDDFGPQRSPGTPLPVGGLGLAYQVQAVVGAVADGSPAAAAGVQPNDRIKQVRFYSGEKEPKAGKWDDVPAHQWAFLDAALQEYPHKLDCRLDRGGQTVEVTLTAVDDVTWPVFARGLYLEGDTRPQKADGFLDALRLGGYRTLRGVKTTYRQLYAIVVGRISYKVISGPITLAQASYYTAQRDTLHLLLLMAMISINLAVVNFLPIPVLDGGHMVFLAYEGLTGRPPPAALHAGLTYLGLAVVGCLMLFVIGLDVWRQIGW